MSNEEMTLAEYVVESENYFYSKEYFELVRECGELNLMAIYAEGTDYLAENADTLSSEAMDMLLVEAGDEDKKTEVFNAGENKGKGLLKRIVGIIKTAFNAVKGFFRRIWEWLVGKGRLGREELSKKLKSAKVKIAKGGKDLKTKVANAIEKGKAEIKALAAKGKDGIMGLTPAGKKKKVQDALVKEVHDFIDTWVDSSSDVYEDMFEVSALLANKGEFKIPKLYAEGETWARDLADVLDILGNAPDKSLKTTLLVKKLRALKTSIEGGRVNEAGAATIVVNWDVFEIEGHITALDASLKSFERIGDRIETIRGSMGSNTAVVGELNAVIQELAIVAPMYKKATAEAIKALQEFIANQNKAITVFAKYADVAAA